MLPQDNATAGSLLNRYGVPNYQSFASYGYSAAMHIDNDDSVTVGWISARSSKVRASCLGKIVWYSHFHLRSRTMRAISYTLNGNSSSTLTLIHTLSGMPPKTCTGLHWTESSHRSLSPGRRLLELEQMLTWRNGPEPMFLPKWQQGVRHEDRWLGPLSQNW